MQSFNQFEPLLSALLQRDSAFVPAAPFEASVGPPRQYYEVRADFRRDMAALYPKKETYRYHNQEDHIEAGVVYLSKLAQRCKKEGIPLDLDVIDAAWRAHDAGYANDPATLGFKSREHMHATIAYRSLRLKGVEELFARRVERAIACTNVFETPITNEDKAIRAADMHNLAQDYPQMRDNSLRLYEEMRNTTDAALSVPDFVRSSVKYLGLYMLPYLRLTSAAADDAGRSEWHIRAFDNVLRLWREHCSVTPQILAVIGGQITPAKLIERRGLASGHEGVIIGASEGRAKEFHSSASRLLRRWGSDAAVVCTPMIANTISLPDDSVNEVLLGAADFEQYLDEANRILTPAGTLTLIADFSHLSLQRTSEISSIMRQHRFELVSEENDVHGGLSRFRQILLQ